MTSSGESPDVRSGRFFGQFSGDPVVRFLPDGRFATVEEDLEFQDPNGLTWLAPKGSKVDGASIPRVMWSFIGGPFDGPYRNASIIHDVACNDQNREWQAVHRCFYNGMMAMDAMASFKAKVMYAAVYHFGPRWELTAPHPASVSTRLPMTVADRQFFEDQIALAEAFGLEATGAALSFDAIEHMVPPSLAL